MDEDRKSGWFPEKWVLSNSSWMGTFKDTQQIFFEFSTNIFIYCSTIRQLGSLLAGWELRNWSCQVQTFDTGVITSLKRLHDNISGTSLVFIKQCQAYVKSSWGIHYRWNELKKNEWPLSGRQFSDSYHHYLLNARSRVANFQGDCSFELSLQKQVLIMVSWMKNCYVRIKNHLHFLGNDQLESGM